jgi:hypothetical protein
VADSSTDHRNGSANHRDQCLSLHVVVRIVSYHRSVGLRRDQPAADDHRLTGDTVSPRTLALPMEASNLLMAYSSLDLTQVNTEVLQTQPWLTFGHPGQRG